MNDELQNETMARLLEHYDWLTERQREAQREVNRWAKDKQKVTNEILRRGSFVAPDTAGQP